jgi:hypothetical protein
MRYVRGGSVPKKVAEGRVLAHNNIRHSKFMKCGENGFRAWTWPNDKVPTGFVPCGCSYAGLPHVAHANVADYKCEPWEVIKTYPSGRLIIPRT